MKITRAKNPYVFTEEARNKIRIALKGKPKSEKHKQNLKDAKAKNPYIFTDEVKKKLSALMTPERRKKISETVTLYYKKKKENQLTNK